MSELESLDPSAPDYKEQFEARLALEGNDPLMGRETFPEVVEVLNKLVKDDEYSVKQIYLHSLSAYATEPSNLQTLAPTSEGKTYPLTTTCSIFPKGDVWSLGGMSPTALVHDHSILVDKDTNEPLDEKLTELYDQRDEAKLIEDSGERKTALKEIDKQIRELFRNSVNEINLENRIICFLDKPRNQTVDMLKPILSHDKYETYYKITNRTQKVGLTSETIKLKGWPAVLVASTRVAANEDTWGEIVSRFDTISPNMSREKYRAAIQLTAQIKGLPHELLSATLGLERLEWATETTARLIDELKKIRESNRTPGTFTPNVFWVPFYEHLGEDLPADVGRHMRDGGRFFTILQMHAAANVFNRPRLMVNNKPNIIVTRRDYDEAKLLYFSGERGESLLTGLPERVLNWFDLVFMPCWDDVLATPTDDAKKPEKDGQTKLKQDPTKPPMIWVTTSQLTDKTKDKWVQPLTTDGIRRNYLNELENAGYVDVQDQPTDKRAKHYRPLVENNTRKKRLLDDSTIFSLDSLREALDMLRKIVAQEGDILIKNYDGSPMTVEELHKKYFMTGGSLND